MLAGSGALPRREVTAVLASVWRRLRADGVLSGQVLRTAVATAAGYQAGLLTSSPYPVFAALAAMLVVQVTVYDTLTRSWQRVAGVILGVLVAYAIARWLGLHWWSIGTVVLVSIALGRLLRLGDAGAVQIPVSGLLVLTVGVNGGYAAARVVETVIGAAVGIAVNLVLAPRPHTRDAGKAVSDLATALADVLTRIASGLRETWPAGADRWLAEARLLEPRVQASREIVERAQTGVRLNPRGARLAPAALRRQLAQRALEHVAVQVRGIARTLADQARSTADGTPVPARSALADALAAAAEALRAYAVVVASAAHGDKSAPAVALRDAIEAARSAVTVAVQEARRHPDWEEGAWLVYGALLTDLGRLLGELDGSAQRELLDAVLMPRPRLRPVASRYRSAGTGPSTRSR